MSHPTIIPGMPSYMLGVVRIRGELVPVLDTSQILYRRPYTETEKRASSLCIQTMYMSRLL